MFGYRNTLYIVKFWCRLQVMTIYANYRVRLLVQIALSGYRNTLCIVKLWYRYNGNGYKYKQDSQDSLCLCKFYTNCWIKLLIQIPSSGNRHILCFFELWYRLHVMAISIKYRIRLVHAHVHLIGIAGSSY